MRLVTLVLKGVKMPLTSSQLENIKQWIESRSPILNCAGCGGREWAIQNEVAFALLVEPKDGHIDYHKGYPMVVINCKNCGYSAFFNAIQLGIMPDTR